MAEVVEQFTFNRGPRGSGGKYARFFDGRVWRLQRGVDFKSGMDMGSLVASLAVTARRSGKGIRSQRDGNDAVYVQAYDKA